MDSSRPPVLIRAPEPWGPRRRAATPRRGASSGVRLRAREILPSCADDSEAVPTGPGTGRQASESTDPSKATGRDSLLDVLPEGYRFEDLSPAHAVPLAAAYRRNRGHLAPWEPLREESFYTDEGQATAVAGQLAGARQGQLAA